MGTELPPLGDLEHEVMQHIWEGGPATADRIRKLIRRRLNDATIRTVLRRLEEKGYVRHAVDGRAFVYEAVEPRNEVAAKAAMGVAERFCAGSVEELLRGLVDASFLDRSQLLTLAAKLPNGKKR